MISDPGKANVHQMYDLGKEIGKMHRLLNDGTLGIKIIPNLFPPCRKERLALEFNCGNKQRKLIKFNCLLI